MYKTILHTHTLHFINALTCTHARIHIVYIIIQTHTHTTHTQRAIACSMNFPLELYLLNTVGVVSTSFSASDSQIAGKDTIMLNMTSSQVQPNMVYSLTVSACIFVTCRESTSAVTFSELLSLPWVC